MDSFLFKFGTDHDLVGCYRDAVTSKFKQQNPIQYVLCAVSHDRLLFDQS
jgi:hypothetical protein